MRSALVDADGGRQGLAARPKVVLSPCAEDGMDDGAALIKTRPHEVSRAFVYTHLGRHGAHDGDFVSDLGCFGEKGGDLKVAFGGDGIAGVLFRSSG